MNLIIALDRYIANNLNSWNVLASGYLKEFGIPLCKQKSYCRRGCILVGLQVTLKDEHINSRRSVGEAKGLWPIFDSNIKQIQDNQLTTIPPDIIRESTIL